MSLSAQIFGRDSFIHRATNVLGLGVPGWLDRTFGPKDPDTPSPTIPTVQDSAYGNPIPRFDGMVGTAGNVIWLKGGKLDVTVKKKKSGGKGGGSASAQPTYSYFATFALALGEGPIVGIRRMWCADKLIYNAGSDDLETIIAGNTNSKGWKLYRGTDDQLPDPDIQADKGVENTPAYRGLAYIKFKKFALKNYGDSLAGSQFKIELVTSSAGSAEVVYAQPTVIQAGHSLCFTVFNRGASEICRIADQPNTDILPEVTNVYRTSGIFREPFPVSSAPIPIAVGMVVVGDVDYALIAPVSGQILTNRGVFAGYPTNLASSIFRATYDDGVMYLRYNSSGRIYANSPSGFYQSSASDYILHTVGETYVYGLTATRIDILEKHTMELVSTVAYAPEFTINATESYASFDGGTLWILPQNHLNILQGFNPTTGERIYRIESDAFDVDVLSSTGQAGIIYNNVMYRREDATGGYVKAIALSVLSASKVQLSQVVSREILLTGLLGVADFDVSLLTQQVTGYRRAGGSVRSAIEPLRAAWPFDARMHGYKLQFVPRGQASIVSIPGEDLAANDGDEIGDSLPYDREMDTQLPATVTVKGISAAREYADSAQTFGRVGTTAVKGETVDLGLVLSDDELMQIAEKICELRWMERQPLSFNLPPPYQQLEPGDVVTVMPKFGVFEIRLTEVSTGANGIVECKGMLNNAALYTSNAVGAPAPGPDGTIPLEGESVAVLMDIPVVDETVQNSPGFVVAMSGYTDGWSGGVLVQSPDNGQTWSDLQAFTTKCTFGNTFDVLPASNCTLIDQRALTVMLISGDLESVTRDQMLAGINYAAYGSDGRWEIVRFQTAALQSDGTYRVSGFVRGQRGTEWTTGLHQRGDWFVLLDDPDNAFVGMPVESIGITRLYRAVSSGATIDSATDQSLAYRGVNLECLSPVYAKGVRDGSGNFSGTFTRRSRLSSSWWTNGVQAPVGETTEAYEIDVISGVTVKRTIAVSSAAWAYSTADQTTDFGAPQSSITFRIYQLSGTVGRGYPLEVTL